MAKEMKVGDVVRFREHGQWFIGSIDELFKESNTAGYIYLEGTYYIVMSRHVDEGNLEFIAPAALFDSLEGSKAFSDILRVLNDE